MTRERHQRKLPHVVNDEAKPRRRHAGSNDPRGHVPNVEEVPHDSGWVPISTAVPLLTTMTMRRFFGIIDMVTHVRLIAKEPQPARSDPSHPGRGSEYSAILCRSRN